MKGTKRQGTHQPLQDLQQLEPTAWCIRCRGEIYRGTGPLCPACRAELEAREERRA